MAKRTTMRIWVCPSCEGGVRAPSKPRTDDVRRYCLGCSEEAGRLVLRTCPSLERERAARQQRARAARARRADAAQRRRSERLTFEGMNLEEEMKRLARLPAFGGARGPLARAMPTLSVRRAKSARYLGYRDAAKNAMTVVLTPHSTVESVVARLLWSLTMLYAARYDDYVWAEWGRIHRLFFEAAEEAWPDLQGHRRRVDEPSWVVVQSVQDAMVLAGILNAAPDDEPTLAQLAAFLRVEGQAA